MCPEFPFSPSEMGIEVGGGLGRADSVGRQVGRPKGSPCTMRKSRLD